MIAYADSASATAAAQSILAKINDVILFPLMTLMLAVALLVFLWGAFEFIANAGNDGAQSKGRQHMLYGVIGLLIMVSAYTILMIAAGTFGIPISGSQQSL
ncbi:hypothetical protein GW943_01005 [Candidatus Parcubacteria bacterium]|uniref:Uncharacterized protein n=1 Tax=Candidatus Kaiserbacteria bacterium CG10_big_fil_rev_8_21_14_0_10_47_16 TaxID=1974608 RepID=A0A2H0UFF4_9BACT|nr:hypothetical protein [Candidatus Parcubacteria bacterium]PIR84406.1 MAG: hypothetical protein COU16_02385 [Candidatus Kaiserbacteria bacterium CG10_big_fil_rev_8_21_14_0_10_47_16]